MKMLRKFMLMGIVLLLPVLAAVEKTYAAEDGMITDLTDKEESPEDGSDTENTGRICRIRKRRMKKKQKKL